MKNFPSAVVGMAYIASGLACTCSYYMLRQMMNQSDAQIGGEIITKLWPVVVILSSFCLARMSGHLWNRGIPTATAIVACGFIFLESISISTSYFSALTSLKHKQAQEIANAPGAEQTRQITAAGAASASSLAKNLQDMEGGRFFSRSNQTAAELKGIMEAQTQLLQAQKEAAEISSVTASAMSDTKQKWWAFLAALSLSVAAIFPSLGLGLAGDTPKKHKPRLSVVGESK